MADGSKKYYWLKLHKDFFKQHEITIVEAMPNGKDYVLFYLKLLCESVSHDGNLRFSENIPYNEEMLASLTRTNIDVVRSAVKIFTELQMMEIMDDGTLYMSQVAEMIGSESKWAKKKRDYRERQKVLNGGQCPQDVLPMSDKSKEQRDKSKENILQAGEKAVDNSFNPISKLFTQYDVTQDQIDVLMDNLRDATKHLRNDDPELDYWRLYDEMSDLITLSKERGAKHIVPWLKKVIATTDFQRTGPDFMRGEA